MKIVLFDIDGTLISSGGAGTRALEKAFREIFSIDNAFEGISMAGKTDIRIIREGLVRHGIPSENGIVPHVIGAYLRNLSQEIPVAHSKHVKPGIREILDHLNGGLNGHFSTGLLTGNVEEGAKIKLCTFGLDRFFRFGAFGSDNEDRNALLPVALERYRSLTNGNASYRDCIVIGDTPRDVECAKIFGAACIAVATGPYSAEILRTTEADAVLDTLSDTSSLLGILSSL